MSLLQSMKSGISAGAKSTETQESNAAQPLPFDENTKNVADEVSNITSQNSLSMRSASAAGKRNAASRGLINSTVGAEASQRAMVNAALPMAQQNVSQRQQIKMQEDSVRANTVGEYIKSVNGITTGFMDAYKDIQASEIPANEKSAAIRDLVVKRDQNLSSIKNMFTNLTTTEQDWSGFPDLM